jgi:hypothetical protein
MRDIAEEIDALDDAAGSLVDDLFSNDNEAPQATRSLPASNFATPIVAGPTATQVAEALKPTNWTGSSWTTSPRRSKPTFNTAVSPLASHSLF